MKYLNYNNIKFENGVCKFISVTGLIAIDTEGFYWTIIN